MDQIKIGAFIAERRKAAGFTQRQLAEQLGITDRAVSKWETGRSMPDASLIPTLCRTLGISINDLFTGEVVTMEHYREEMEQNLLTMAKQKEESDRHLLRLELVLGIVCILPLVAAVILVLAVPMEEWLGGLIAGLSVIPLLVATPFAIKIEQKAGYYACAHCGNRYVPSYGSVFAAMHMGRTRYMKCPECGKRSWHKKVLQPK